MPLSPSAKRYLPWLAPLLLVLAWGAAMLWLDAGPAPQLRVDACDVAAQPCRVSLPGGASLELAFSPRPPVLMQPVDARVSTDLSAERIWLDLVGINMDMGPNRAELSAAAGGLWEGRFVLPVCSAAEMHWEARLVVVREGEKTVVAFPFVTRP